MDKNLPEAVRASVFYCRKSVDNSTKFECCVVMMPMREFHCCTYNFIISISRSGNFEYETVQDVTTDIGEAERIFDILCRNTVHPCHLSEVICDLIL
ncbi:MAG: hypothetical protein IJY93_02110 [Clostridia bacterium]|nr:hypothetical protein [Clostridia bacterium]